MRASLGIILLIAGLVIGTLGGYFARSGQIDSLQGQVTSLQSSNAALQDQVLSLRTRITTLQGNVSALQANLSYAYSQMANMNGTYVIVISGHAFNPSTITIAVGTTITWINLDQVNHTVTSSIGVWDSGDITPNGSFSYTFNAEGSFSYYCGYHPAMTGVVKVNPPVLAALTAKDLLDPKTIPKYVNQLIANIPVYMPTITYPNGTQDYEVHMVSTFEQILPTGTPLAQGSSGLTKVWGYQGLTNAGIFVYSPSATFEAIRGVPIYVKWVNDITEPQFLPVDPTIMWADPNYMGTVTQPFNPYPPGFALAQSPVPLVPHLHGGEVPSISDGGPNAWFTYNGIHGPAYSTNPNKPDPGSNAAWFYYPNEQQATTLWYHDHALGMTRLNVMSGLAGFYILRDPNNPTDSYLSGHFTYGVNEIPLAIQDRSFYADGSLWFPTVGINPTVHPYWFSEFFGNTIMVNGKVWPNLDVTPGWYRFRILDGSNARFYTLSFSNMMPFTVIGTEGGYLMAPFTTTSITIAPAERADILVDFSAIPVGTKIILTNTAKAPFPGGAPADPQTVGQIMQFTVKATSATAGASAPTLPTPLNPTLAGGVWPTLPTPTKTRIMTLYVVAGPAKPEMMTINGQHMDGVITENPKEGTTEDWVIVNLTPDTHPIHLHLVTFQLVSRQSFQVSKYTEDWLALNAPYAPPFPTSYVPKTLDPTPYLLGNVTGPFPNEMGWKDTVQMNPGEVIIIRIRFTQQDGTPFGFDPTVGPGYVWHCHIIDHEDNEMMRPYIVTP